MADQDILTLGRELGYSGKDLEDFLRDERLRRRNEIRDEMQFQFELQERKAKLRKEEDELSLALVKEQLKLEAAREANNHSRELGDEREPRSQVFHKLMPPFDESKDDMDSYLLRFERLALARKWPESEWASALSLHLAGDALEVYARIPPDDSVDYKKLRNALLLRFRLTEEGFRESFRNNKPKDGETATQFLARLSMYIERWIELSHTEKQYEALRDLIIREQFLSKCEGSLAVFLKERTYSNLEEIGKAADRFIEAQGFLSIAGKFSNAENTSTTKKLVKPEKLLEERKAQTVPNICYVCRKVGHRAMDCHQNPNRHITCLKCGRRGHRAVDCGRIVKNDFHPIRRDFNVTTQNTGASTQEKGRKAEASAIKCVYTEQGDKIDVVMSTIQNPDELFIVPGMPVVNGLINNQKGTVLRDSGCNTVIVRESLIKPDQLTGKQKAIYFLDQVVKILSEVEIEIDTPYFKGKTLALIMTDPLYDLTLGNVPGVRGVENPNREWVMPILNPEGLRDTKVVEYQTKQEKESEEIVPEVNAVTRAHSKLMLEERKTKPLKVAKINIAEITPENLQKLQKEDTSLQPCFQKIEQTYTQRNDKNEYTFIFRNNILYRKQKTPTGEKYQLIVPEQCRKEILALAHDTIMAAHLGITKTKNRILTEFYWPGLAGDVKRYVKSCDICQRTVPRGQIPKAPLVTMPIIETPFKRVAIDIIGPLQPRSEQGNSYILTLVDYATRYPEAIALKRIDAETVAEALVEMFSRLGIPEEILHDRGTQLVSGLMQETCRLLAVKQLTTTPYHPMCNGLVENFNGTLKRMIKRLCSERPKDWDRYLAPALFAYREVPQESTGFSPFELLYGRHVRGPLAILKTLWTKDDTEEEIKTLYQYVVELRTRLEDTCQRAHDELNKSSSRYKKIFDRKAKSRQLKVGEQVLVLLPTKQNKLVAQWKGPFPIVERLNDHDFRVQTKKRVKTFHINLLKKYETRDNSHQPTQSERRSEKIQLNAVLMSEEKCYSHENQYLIPTVPEPRETVENVILDASLTEKQAHQLRSVLTEFSDIFVDIPGKTSVEECNLKLRTDQHIFTKQYPLPYAVKNEIDKEVKRMLDMGIIEQSTSPYNSPVLLTRKPDGTHRLCIDFRNLNKITEVSAEPMDRPSAIFDKLSEDRFFSKIDLTKGYWQIPMSKESKEKTAFSTDTGHYQFCYLPFGINDAPAVFTRTMRKVLKGIQNVDNFFDDILIHTRTWEEHITAIREICRRLKEAGFTARPSKCDFGRKQIEFLGHHIGKGEIKPTENLTKKIFQAPRPKTKKQLRAFLGLTGFYRNFIPHYADVAAPLTDLTRKGTPNQIPWTSKAESAFITLKRSITKEPVLHLPDLNKSFVVRTDASNAGLGAILLQSRNDGDDDMLHPVAYASRKLLPREVAYSTLEKECLAIVWALQKFHVYLYGRKFKIQTDHEPLTCLQQSYPKNNRLKRWAILLQEYMFSIETIKGIDNVGADYLSRIEE